MVHATTDAVAAYLADLATETRAEDLTPQTRHAVKRVLVDALGCGLGAYYAGPIRALRALAKQRSATQPSSLIGSTIRTAPEIAALTNGAMIRYADFSDDYFGGIGSTGPHPSDNIGGLLAAAESVGATGHTLMLAVAIAYEACGRLMDQATFGAQSGWDYAVLHAIATALGSARILGLSRAQTEHALALAVVPNVSLGATRRGQLSNWKGIAGPNGSRNGLFAALLAEVGITGPSAPLDGPAGLFAQLGTPFELPPVAERRCISKIQQTSFKFFPVRYGMQLPIWVALGLRAQVRLDDVAAIRLYCVRRYARSRADDPAAWDPRSRETADHSAPYLIAAALVDGAITDQTFEPERYRDPAILALASKITLVADDEYTALFPEHVACRLEIALQSGAIVSGAGRDPKGHRTNPLTDAELEQKFLGQTDGILASGQGQRILDLVWRIDEVTDLRELFARMVVP